MTYLAALVERYGPDGTFWTDHPELPKHPLREWQIWNEPHLQDYWAAPEKGPYGYVRNYPPLLRSSYNIVKSLDPGAKIVHGGHHAAGLGGDRAALPARDQALLRRGGAPDLPPDGEARRQGHQALPRRDEEAPDGRKPIYLTEITWPASKGRTEGIKYQRQETPRGWRRS